MYFSRMPNGYFPFIINGEEQFVQLKDITYNVRFIKDLVSNVTLYDLYDIKDGETPEIIAEKFYGSPLYHWVVMLVNERYDYLADFPLAYVELEQYVKDKYGEDQIYATHHYENSEGYVVDSSQEGAQSISNFQYEESVNESKRTIKLIDKRLIEQIVSEYVKAMTV